MKASGIELCCCGVAASDAGMQIRDTHGWGRDRDLICWDSPSGAVQATMLRNLPQLEDGGDGDAVFKVGDTGR